MRAALIATIAAVNAFLFVPVQQAVDGKSTIISTKSSEEIPGDSPVEKCDADVAHLVDIERIDLVPNPPIPGDNLTISAVGTLNVDIVDGSYVDVVVNYGFIQLLRQRYDLCEALGEADLECPLEKGRLSLTRTVQIPSNVPPGEYTALARAYTPDDELLTCIAAEVELGF